MASSQPPSSAGLNSTAFRIFKLLRWLVDKPMTVDMFNDAFEADAFVGKRLSTDTIWLYLNTLKELGCEISRPSPSNQYHYELLYHPFGLNLNKDDLACLAQLKLFAEDHFSYKEMLALDELIKQLLFSSSLQEPKGHLARLLNDTRSIDYKEQAPLISSIEGVIAAADIVEFTYNSPDKGLRQLLCMPLRFIYRGGSLYLLGLLPERKEASLLRLDRIVEVRLDCDVSPELRSALAARRAAPQQIVLQVFINESSHWAGLGMDETVKPVVLAHGLKALEVTVCTFDSFQLKQRLLQLPEPFTVLEPLYLKEDLQATLEQMQAFYLPEEELLEEEFQLRHKPPSALKKRVVDDSLSEWLL